MVKVFLTQGSNFAFDPIIVCVWVVVKATGYYPDIYSAQEKWQEAG